jgi:hypothetical protein
MEGLRASPFDELPAMSGKYFEGGKILLSVNSLSCDLLLIKTSLPSPHMKSLDFLTLRSRH